MKAFFADCLRDVKALAGRAPASILAVSCAALICTGLIAVSSRSFWIIHTSIYAAWVFIILDTLALPRNRWIRAAAALGGTALLWILAYRAGSMAHEPSRLIALHLLLPALFVLAQMRRGAGKLLVLAGNAALFGALYLLFVIIYAIFFLTVWEAFRWRILADNLFPAGCCLAAFVLFLFLLARTAKTRAEDAPAISAAPRYRLLYGILYFSAFAYAALVALYFLSCLLGAGKNQASVMHLVVWSSGFSLFLLWLKALGEKARAVDFIFAALLAVLCAGAFWAACVRIEQYGLTPNRYFIFVAALWLIFSCGCFLLRGDCRLALASFVLLTLAGVWTPLGAVNLSVRSQIRQLEALEKIPANKERIASITKFLEAHHKDSLIPEPTRKAIAQIKPIIIKLEARLEEAQKEVLDIAAYDYALLNLREDQRECRNSEVTAVVRKGVLRIEYQNAVQAEINLPQILRAGLPVESEKESYRYEIAPGKRWIKVQGPDMDVAVYVREATLRWERSANAPETMYEKRPYLYYDVFLTRRPRE